MSTALMLMEREEMNAFLAEEDLLRAVWVDGGDSVEEVAPAR
jgi:hypothetical protein